MKVHEVLGRLNVGEGAWDGARRASGVLGRVFGLVRVVHVGC